MFVQPFIVLFVALFIANSEVAGAPSWPSWATQTIPACPKGTKYTVRHTWSGATYGICAEKTKKSSEEEEKLKTAGSSLAPQPTSTRDELNRIIKKGSNLKKFGKTTITSTSTTRTTAKTTTRPSKTTATRPTRSTKTTTTTTTRPTKTSMTTRKRPTTTSSTKPTPLAFSTSPSSTDSEMETSITVTPGKTLSNIGLRTKEDDFHPRITIGGVKDNGLENSNDSAQEKEYENEKVYESTSTTQHQQHKEKVYETTSVHNDNSPQGLAWIDFDYNNQDQVNFDYNSNSQDKFDYNSNNQDEVNFDYNSNNQDKFDYNSNNQDKVKWIEFDLTSGGNFYAYDYDHVILPRSPKAIVVVP